MAIRSLTTSKRRMSIWWRGTASFETTQKLPRRDVAWNWMSMKASSSTSRNWRRIGTYWDFLNRPDLDGSDNVAWSAAFVSYMVHLAGAGNQFPYNSLHAQYFYRTINDRLIKKKTSFWGYPVGEIEIGVGDILGMNRSNKPPIKYDWAAHHNDYKSHADIVVSCRGR